MKDERVDINRGIEDAQVRHSYPYSSLPLLESHLHPKFAIYDAGMKLKNLLFNREYLIEALANYPSLSKIQDLYRGWNQIPPIHAQEDKTYVDPDFVLAFGSQDGSGDGKGDGKGDSDDPIDKDYYVGQPKRTRKRTILGRGDGLYLQRRTGLAADQQAGNENDDLRPRTRSVVAAEKLEARNGAPAKKRKVLSESFSHNQHLLSEATLSRINQQFGEAAWTADRIRRWSSSQTKRR